MNKLIDREIEFNESIVYISQDNQQDLIFYLHAMDHYGILNKKEGYTIFGGWRDCSNQRTRDR